MVGVFISVLLLVIAAIGIALVVEFRAFARSQTIQGLLATFAPGMAAVHQEPRALLVWYPLAETARRLLPAAFAELDRAAGFRFPFTKAQLQAAHAQWTAEWLAWEQTHDGEYKLKAGALDWRPRRGCAARVRSPRPDRRHRA